MNIYTWIFTGFLAVDLLLYIIGLVQRIDGLEKTARSLFIPFVAGIILSLLVNYLPDAYHIIFISSFAFGSAVLFMLTALNIKNRFFKFAEHFLFLLTEAFWFLLIISIYRIYNVSELFFIFGGIVFIAGFVVICVFIKKQTVAKYAAAFIQYFFAAVLCTTALICLVYEKRLFDILFFCGTLTMLCHVIFEIFQRTKPFDISRKTEKIIVTILFVTGQTLMGTAAVLMQI